MILHVLPIVNIVILNKSLQSNKFFKLCIILILSYVRTEIEYLSSVYWPFIYMFFYLPVLVLCPFLRHDFIYVL